MELESIVKTYFTYLYSLNDFCENCFESNEVIITDLNSEKEVQ